MNIFTLAQAEASYTDAGRLISVSDLENRIFVAVDDATLTRDGNIILNTANGSPRFWKAINQYQNSEIFLGFMVDKSPIFGKRVTGTLTAGSAFVNIAHGIANAYTNNRILNVLPHADSGITHMKNIYTSGGAGLVRTTWDNTNVTLIRGSAAGTYTVYCFLIYKV